MATIDATALGCLAHRTRQEVFSLTTLNRRDFVTRSSTPLPVAERLRQVDPDAAAVRRADGNGNGRIEGPRERRASWDEAIALQDRFERSTVCNLAPEADAILIRGKS